MRSPWDHDDDGAGAALKGLWTQAKGRADPCNVPALGAGSRECDLRQARRRESVPGVVRSFLNSRQTARRASRRVEPDSGGGGQDQGNNRRKSRCRARFHGVPAAVTQPSGCETLRGGRPECCRLFVLRHTGATHRSFALHGAARLSSRRRRRDQWSGDERDAPRLLLR